MSWAARRSVAAQLESALRRMQQGAAVHEPRALARRAALRQGVSAPFGGVPAADAALSGLLRFSSDVTEELPELTPHLGRLLDDALTVASLVAMTKVVVRDARDGEASPPRRGSLGRDLRPLKTTRESSAAEDLMIALLGASHEELRRHLRRAIALLASDGHHLDVRALVGDLGDWEREDRWVQKRWAYDFWFRAGTDESEHDEQEST